MYQRIRCPTCHGTKREPSVIVSAWDWCRSCDGQGWFIGYPSRLPTISEYVKEADERTK